LQRSNAHLLSCLSATTDSTRGRARLVSRGPYPQSTLVKPPETYELHESASADNPSWHRRRKPTASRRSGRISVLIADDDEDARKALGELLELAGHSVHVCGDGVDALRMAREFHPDVVFLDIEMPGLNGYAVCSQLRATGGFEQTKVYALSGLSGPAHESRCQREGFNGQLVKPLDIAALDRLM
jgi:CheY-like chemotaxis protein